MSLDSTDTGRHKQTNTDRQTDTHTHIQGSQSEKSRKKHAFAVPFYGTFACSSCNFSAVCIFCMSEYYILSFLTLPLVLLLLLGGGGIIFPHMARNALKLSTMVGKLVAFYFHINICAKNRTENS